MKHHAPWKTICGWTPSGSPAGLGYFPGQEAGGLLLGTWGQMYQPDWLLSLCCNSLVALFEWKLTAPGLSCFLGWWSMISHPLCPTFLVRSYWGLSSNIRIL